MTGPEIAQWERISDLKGSIMTIPTAQEGYFRYLISEKRFAIFCRLNENLLQGIIGYDEETIDLLKRQFDREFFTTAIRSGRRPARQHIDVPP